MNRTLLITLILLLSLLSIGYAPDTCPICTLRYCCSPGYCDEGTITYWTPAPCTHNPGAQESSCTAGQWSPCPQNVWKCYDYCVQTSDEECPTDEPYCYIIQPDPNPPCTDNGVPEVEHGYCVECYENYHCPGTDDACECGKDFTCKPCSENEYCDKNRCRSKKKCGTGVGEMCKGYNVAECDFFYCSREGECGYYGPWNAHVYYYECDGNSADHTSDCDKDYCNCYKIKKVDDYDGWYDTGNTRWVDDDTNPCKEKKQKEQEYRDYYCSYGEMKYSVTNTRWIDTGNKRNKADGASCGEPQESGNTCYYNFVCSSGQCVYSSDSNKPSTYYESNNHCYYNCNVQCTNSGWSRSNCTDDGVRPCDGAVCTENGWDTSGCNQPPSITLYAPSNGATNLLLTNGKLKLSKNKNDYGYY